MLGQNILKADIVAVLTFFFFRKVKCEMLLCWLPHLCFSVVKV